ncbi:hypothetical protein JCM11491_002769 [Sporobolomyces phaffii]
MVRTRSGGRASTSSAAANLRSGGRRKRGRRTAAKQLESGSEWDDSSDDDSESDLETDLREQVRKTARRRRSKAASLSQLPGLPIDILADIGSHLALIDLVHLSRVSKSFFNLVDGPSFKSVWIDVRKGVGLPDLSADGLSELQYAALVSDHYCHVCGKANAKAVDFFVRKRYCPTCRKANLTPVVDHVRKIKAHPFLYECALSSLRGGSGANLRKTVYYHFPSLLPLNATLHAIQSRIDAFRPATYHGMHSKNHNAVARRYRALAADGDRVWEEFEDDERELRYFVMEKREHKECVDKDAEKLEKWLERQQSK